MYQKNTGKEKLDRGSQQGGQDWAFTPKKWMRTNVLNGYEFEESSGLDKRDDRPEIWPKYI